MPPKKGQFTAKAKGMIEKKPSSMADMLEDPSKPENHNDVNTEKHKDVKKTVHLEYEINEKLRLLVFNKRFRSERAVIEEALRLLFKSEKI